MDGLPHFYKFFHAASWMKNATCNPQPATFIENRFLSSKLLTDAEYFFKAYLQPYNRLIHSILQGLTEGEKFVRGDRLGTAFLQRN